MPSGKWDAFLSFCRGHRSGDIDFAGEEDSGIEDLNPDRLIAETPLAQANSVSSRTVFGNLHRPTLDLDMPCLLMDSSTPGHHHLIIDRLLTWDEYQKLLECLADVGILQRGFVEVSIKLQQTWLRTPWTKKGDNAPVAEGAF